MARDEQIQVAGKKVRALRAQQNLTQDEMAAAADMSLSGYRRLEYEDRTGVRLKKLRALAQSLKVPFDELRARLAPDEPLAVPPGYDAGDIAIADRLRAKGTPIIGEKLGRMMAKAGASVDEVAAAVGLTPQEMAGRLLPGPHWFSPAELEKLAQALKAKQAYVVKRLSPTDFYDEEANILWFGLPSRLHHEIEEIARELKVPREVLIARFIRQQVKEWMAKHPEQASAGASAHPDEPSTSED